MNEIITLIIAALATYGISGLVSTYDGPYDVFLSIRKKYPRSPFTCAVCLAVWVAIPVFLIVLAGWVYFLILPAIIGIVILLERV